MKNSLLVLAYLLLLVPLVLVFGAGGYLLFASAHGLSFFLVTVSLLLLGLGAASLSRRDLTVEQPVPPAMRAGRDLEAWSRASALVRRLEQSDTIPDKVQLEALLRKLAATIAAEYHPKSDSPELQASPADMLLALEQVSRELRLLLLEHIPLQRSMTVNELLRAKKTLGFVSLFLSLVKGAAASRLLMGKGKFFPGLWKMLALEQSSRVPARTVNYLLARLLETAARQLMELYGGRLGAPHVEAAEGITVPPLRILMTGAAGEGRRMVLSMIPGAKETMESLGNELLPVYKAELAPLGDLFFTLAPPYGTRRSRRLLEQVARKSHLALVLASESNLQTSRRIIRSLRESARKDEIPLPVVVALSHLTGGPPDSGVSGAEAESEAAARWREKLSDHARTLNIDPSLVVPLDELNSNLDLLMEKIGLFLDVARARALVLLAREGRAGLHLRDILKTAGKAGRLLISQALKR